MSNFETRSEVGQAGRVCCADHDAAVVLPVSSVANVMKLILIGRCLYNLSSPNPA